MKFLEKIKVVSILCVITLILGLTYTSSPFIDIQDHWAKEEITWAYEIEMVNGYEDGSFKPNDNISKVEFYKIINTLIHNEKKTTPSFLDVYDSDWFYGDISKAIASGYIENSQTNIEPTNPITRNEVARIISKVYNLPQNENSAEKFSDFKDIQNKGEVGALSNLGVLGGYPDGTFRPNSPITRGEVSKIFVNVINILGEEKLEYSTYDGVISEPLSFDENTSDEELSEIFDYLFSVYVSTKSFDNPREESSGYKSVLVTSETGAYLAKVMENNELFNEFLYKGAIGSYYRPINFPYNIAYSGIDTFYFKANYITPEEQLVLENEIKKDIETLKSEGKITDEMTNEEKLYSVYSYLAKKAEYVDDEYLFSDDKLNSNGTFIYSPYAIINGGDTVCQGYAGYFMLMGKELGIDVYYEEGTYTDSFGNTENHAWNSVIDEGTKYHIDPTGGDQAFGVYDKFFYMTEEELTNNGYEKRFIDAE